MNLIPNVESNDEFAVELIKGFNSMIEPKERNKFTNSVSFFFLKNLTAL